MSASTVHVVNSTYALKNHSNIQDRMLFKTMGKDEPYDGGTDDYIYIEGNLTTENGTTVIRHKNNGGSFISLNGVTKTNLPDLVANSASSVEVASYTAQALAARDAALIQAGVYATESAGRAAVADGVAFKVQGSGDVAAYEYRRVNSGSSTLIATYPSKAALDAQAALAAQNALAAQPMVIRDSEGFILCKLYQDGTLETPAFKATTEAFINGKWSVAYSTSSLVGAFTVVDSEGFIGALIDAAGSRIVGLTASNASTPTKPANTVVCFGDSITEGCSIAKLIYDMNRQSDFGFLNYANYYLNASLDMVHNAGVSGNTTSQMLARIQTDVIAYNPDFVTVLGGINDIQAGETVVNTMANLTSIYSTLTAAGIMVLAIPVLPLHTGQANLTNANVGKIYEINRFIAEYARTHDNIILSESFKHFVNVTSATGSAKDYYLQTDDDIHPSPLGCDVLGYHVAEALRPYIQKIDILPAAITDVYSLNNSGNQLFDNPLFQGTSGTNGSPSVVTGNIPNNCRITTSGTWGSNVVTSALAARSDGLGNDWVITVTNTGAVGDLIYLATDDISARLMEGDTLTSACNLELSGLAQLMGCQMQISSTGTTTQIGSALEYTAQQPTTGTPQDWTPAQYSQANKIGVLQTGKMTVPSGTLSNTKNVITLRFGAAGGTAVIKVSRMAINKG